MDIGIQKQIAYYMDHQVCVFRCECVGFVCLLVSVWGFENGLRIVFCHFFQLFHEINCVCLTFYCLVVTKKLYVLCIQKIISLPESIFDRDVEPPFSLGLLDDEPACGYFPGIFSWYSIKQQSFRQQKNIGQSFYLYMVTCICTG